MDDDASKRPGPRAPRPQWLLGAKSAAATVSPVPSRASLVLMTRSLRATLLAVALLATPSCVFGEPKLDLRVVNESASEVQLLYEWGGRADERSVLTVEPNEDTRVEFDRPSLEWHLVVDGTEVTRSEDWPSDNPTIDLTIQIDQNGNASVIDS